MNEDEWLASREPESMLAYLEGKARDRKLRLFACACCRRIVRPSNDQRLLLAVESAERHADGLATTEEMLAAWEAADQAVWAFNGVASEQLALVASERATKNYSAQECVRACRRALEAFEQENSWLPWERRSVRWWSEMRVRAEMTLEEERRYQADLVRCIVGNPFRPVIIDPAWVSPDVLALARVIYNEGGFDRLPFLADALQASGCDDADILDHCRGPGPHVKGCWAVDAILGKS
jgi:hypothetical protein